MLTIYGYRDEINKCIQCTSAKRLCDVKGKEYEFISIADGKDENGPIFNEAVISELLGKLGRESVVGLSMPVIFDGDIHVGSFNELRAYVTKMK